MRVSKGRSKRPHIVSNTRLSICALQSHAAIDMSRNEAIKQAVEAGLGMVSVHTLELETGRLVMLDVEDFPIIRHWQIVPRAGKRLSPVALAFKQFVLDEAPKFIRLPE